MKLPMSLRTAASEEAYQAARLAGQLRSLHDEEVIIAFKHWAIIKNRFPYDSPYRTSHMLIPRRLVPSYNQLKWREKRELRKIIDGHCQMRYHQVVENMNVRRSIHTIYHVHLLVFYDDRKDFKL